MSVNALKQFDQWWATLDEEERSLVLAAAYDRFKFGNSGVPIADAVLWMRQNYDCERLM